MRWGRSRARSHSITAPVRRPTYVYCMRINNWLPYSSFDEISGWSIMCRRALVAAFGRHWRRSRSSPRWMPPDEVRLHFSAAPRVAAGSRQHGVHTAYRKVITSKQVGSASNSLWMARSHYCYNGQGRRLYQRSECLLFSERSG